MAVASIYFAAICFIDTLKSKIPNVANASLAIAGLAFNFSAAGMKGLFLSGAGILVGLALLIVPYLMGGFGAGDVKALAALGALVGPWPIAQIFCYMALIGGILAILHYMINRNPGEKAMQWWQSLKIAVMTRDLGPVTPQKHEPLRFPYAAAIALGYYAWLIRGDLL